MTFRQFRIRLIYAFGRARDEGFFWTVTEIFSRGTSWLIWISLLPLILPLHFAGYRRLPVLTQRIGHLAAEVDCFLKLQNLGEVDYRKNYFILAPENKIANSCLLDYWQDHIKVIRHPFACWLLSLLTRGPLIRHSIKNYLLAIGRSAEYYSVQARWADRPALLKLRANHQEIGRKYLASLGIPSGAWFVCVHARDGGYSSQDESVHSYRNTTLSHLKDAMQVIVARGGWCILMGDSTSQSLPPMVGVIDYAHHQSRSEELDIYLCAECKFFLGNTSGLFLVSTIFDVPSALTNQTPFAATGFHKRDISIPKLIRRKGQTEYLNVYEIMNSKTSLFRMSRLYTDAQLELIENTSDEIKELTIEMLEALDGNLYNFQDAALCYSIFISLLRPEHYSYGTRGKISQSFLLRHNSVFRNRASFK